jgi:hypothetical protein
MRTELFQPTVAGEARLLILIDAFTGKTKSLEGRTKLAKLDFFLRYPNYLKRAIAIRAPDQQLPDLPFETDTIENRMIRYKYGPWDPAYFALLGRLIGRGLIVPIPLRTGIGYRTTDKGRDIAVRLAATDAWRPTVEAATILRRHFDLTGSNLKQFVYSNFPEVTAARRGIEI